MASFLVRRRTAFCPLILKSVSKTNRSKWIPHSFYWAVVEPSLNAAVCPTSLSRCLSHSASPRTSAVVISKSFTSSPAPVTIEGEQHLSLVDTKDGAAVYRERYIPITRHSLIRHLVEDNNFLNEEEKKLFPEFVRSLDSVLVTKYHGVLEELKRLFDPINPDKDTVKSREWTRKEKLDNEFWLLQKLEDVMIKANFHELPKKKVEHFLKDHVAEGNVRVSVDPNRYDILRFWVLGHDIPELKPLSRTRRFLNVLLRRTPPKPKEYFKRVVVALRLKADTKLILKAFKEVPVHSLEMLLPDGNIHMRAKDKGILVSSAALAGFGILTKMVTVLASLKVDWMLAVTLVTGTLGFRVWSTYKNRRNAYLLDVSRTLYFKNIANNQGLLTLLVDRAEDESLKEALLTYTFLLNPASTRKGQGLSAKSRTRVLSDQELKSAVENWLEKISQVKIEFDSSEAVKLLQTVGLLSESDGKYSVLPLDVAARILPKSQQSVIARGAHEADIVDFTKDEYLETDNEYRSEDQKTRKYGWF